MYFEFISRTSYLRTTASVFISEGPAVSDSGILKPTGEEWALSVFIPFVFDSLTNLKLLRQSSCGDMKSDYSTNWMLDRFFFLKLLVRFFGFLWRIFCIISC